MANLGKKWICYSCATKFYDFSKPEAICPKCESNQKNAPNKPRVIKKEKVVLPIEDDFTGDQDVEVAVDDGIEESFGISSARAEGVDPGDLKMDDYDE
jgi:hypothetical protein